jgi:hypothetical protein
MMVEEGFIVRYFYDHPFGIGVYTFAKTLAADAAVRLLQSLLCTMMLLEICA